MTAQAAAAIPSLGRTVDVTNPSGAGRFVVVCEHASNFIPAELDNLGLAAHEIQSHIAWDPGALPVAQALAARLDAPLVAQRVSRLVYDCNRALEAESAVPAVSESTGIPGNSGLSAARRRARMERYYTPFRGALSDCIERRMTAARAPAIVTLHSFAPRFRGQRRDFDIGILHDTDSRFADALLEAAEAKNDFVIRRNEPYGPQDGVMHTLAEHAMPRGLLNAMLEIRHDLIADPGSQGAMAAWLSGRAEEALASLAKTEDKRECVSHAD